MTAPAQLSLFFPPLNLALNGLSDEVGSLLAVLQNGVDAVKRAFREARRGLLVVDLFPAHSRNIDDITNCYKGYFTRYLLLQSSRYLISSKTSKRESDMTKNLTIGTAQITITGNGIFLRYMNTGSFLVGERDFSTETEAREFCRVRSLRVV